MTDPINEIRPGAALSDKQKADLAKANAQATAEAHRLAAEHRAREMGEATKPIDQTLADSIKGKLEREEFQAPEQS